MQRHTVAVTSDASGDATDYTSEPVNGVVHAIRYVRTDLATGVDFVITGAVSGIAILSVSNVATSTTWYPRAATCDVTGVASLYAAAGEPVETGVPVCDEPIKIVTDEGGATLSGTFYIYVGT